MQLKRKPILITGVTRFNLVQVEELIKKYQLFGCSMLVTPEDFTDEYVRMLNRYNVTVMLPFMSTTDHPDSIEENEKRNPGLEARIRAFPPTKLVFLHPAQDGNTVLELLSLVLEFPNHRVVCAANREWVNGFFVTNEQFGQLRGTEEEYKDIEAEFVVHLANIYDVLDYPLIAAIKMCGVTPRPAAGDIHVQQL